MILLLCFLIPILSNTQGNQNYEHPIILKDAKVGDISDAIVDNNGFLWIGGNNGLVKYDGNNFTSFRHNAEDSLSLMTNEVNDLFYNEQTNQLFISTWNTAKGGLSILDLNSEQFKNIKFDSNYSEGLEGHGLHWTFQDKIGQYWISIKGKGLVKYFPTKDSIVHVPYTVTSLQESIEIGRANQFLSYSLDTKNDSLVWLGAIDGAILCFNIFNNKFERYHYDLLKDKSIRSILHHSDNKVYIGTWSNGIYSFDQRTKEVKRLYLDKITYSPELYLDCIRSIKSKSTNILNITTRAGLIEFNLSELKVNIFKKNEDAKNQYYGDFYTDKKDRVLFWKENSLFLFDPLRQQNKFYAYNEKAPTLDFLVRSILEDDKNGKLWIAAQFSEGLYRFDPSDGNWELFLPDKSNFKNESLFMGWDVLKTSKGEVLVLDSENGIFVANEKEQKLVPWNISLASSKYRCFIEDRQGNIWVGTYHDGVYRINLSTKKIRHFKKEFIHPEISGIGAATDLKEDRNGNIWIRSKGIKVYDPKIDSMYLFPYFFSDQKKVFHISQLGLDKDGNVLVGSHEKSLGITDADHPEKGIVKYFDASDGLKMQKPLSFTIDKEDNIWLLGYGLEKIKADRSSSKLYRSSYFSFHEAITFTALSDGTLAVGDRYGIHIVDPNRLRVNQALPIPYIHSFKVFDKDVSLKSTYFQIADVYLKPSENFFSLEFSALNPALFGGTSFQYQLEGADPKWVDPKNRRYVAYTNLKSGSYNFKIKAKNDEGVWNEEPTVLKIHIATPWYKTSWAFLLYAFSVIGFLYFVYHTRINQFKVHEESKRLKELDTFKTRFYANITHEFRTPLTIIQGIASELKVKPKEDSEKKLNLIVKNSQSLLNLVNQMLDLSKIQAGKGNTDLFQDDVVSFLKLLVQSQESYANMQNLGLQFHSEANQIMMDFDSKKLERVILNLLSNAIKFTPEYGKILVLLNKVINSGNAYIEIKVKDSGIGISEENLPYIFDRFHQANPIHNNQGTGIGLAMVKELVDLMNGTINVKSKLNEGSTFTLTLPIQNKAPLSQKGQHYNFTSIPIQNSTVSQDTVLSENGLPIILIIEDNIDLEYYLQACLNEHYQTLSARNGKQGVEKALEILPDIIISDVMMPEMNGFQVCKILKEDEKSCHIPIILLTAKASTEDKLVGLTQGADAYLTKPFEKEELIIRIEKLLLIRKTLQKKYSDQLISGRSSEDRIMTKEEIFLKNLEEVILSHLDEEDFSIHQLSRELRLSRSQVHRKIKALTGMSTSIYIRNVRLQKAKELLNNTDQSISEIAYNVGFKTLSYFSQTYKEAFGENPSSTRK